MSEILTPPSENTAETPRPAMYRLPNGLLGYGAGLGRVGEEDLCLILCVEKDDEGKTWAHVIRLKYAERIPTEGVVHFKDDPGFPLS